MMSDVKRDLEAIEDAKFLLLWGSVQHRIAADEYRRCAARVQPNCRPQLLRYLDDAGIEILPELSMQALYHHEPGRRYRPTKREVDSGKFECPRCHVTMVCSTRKAKDPLYRCPDCAWNIAKSDIFDPEPGEQPQLQPGEYPEGIAPPPDEQQGPW